MPLIVAPSPSSVPFAATVASLPAVTAPVMSALLPALSVALSAVASTAPETLMSFAAMTVALPAVAVTVPMIVAPSVESVPLAVIVASV